jgi:hypothetical protein
MFRIGSPKRLAMALCLLSIAVVVLALLWKFSPSDSGFYPRCPFYSATGLKCPGCGTLRAVHAALRGRFAEAVAMNPILVVMVPLIALFMVRPGLARNRYVGYGVALLVLLY